MCRQCVSAVLTQGTKVTCDSLCMQSGTIKSPLCISTKALAQAIALFAHTSPHIIIMHSLKLPCIPSSLLFPPPLMHMLFSFTDNPYQCCAVLSIRVYLRCIQGLPSASPHGMVEMPHGMVESPHGMVKTPHGMVETPHGLQSLSVAADQHLRHH